MLVSGTGPFIYQWQFDGTNLPNGIITQVFAFADPFPLCGQPQEHDQALLLVVG
jgi:hypothetical protein